MAKSRFLRVGGAQGVVSNRPYLAREALSRHGCRTTLILKQGTQGFPVYYCAHMGYLHVDFKVRTRGQATRKIQTFLQLQSVGMLTSWGYGRICWIPEKFYHEQESRQTMEPRFRILKGLPSDLTPHERQLVMAALLHDLVDTDTHPSKLGRAVTIPEPYVQWLCEQHHASKRYTDNPDLQFLQDTDVRTSRYVCLLPLSTRRRKLAPVNTPQLVRHLEEAAHARFTDYIRSSISRKS